MSKVTIEINCNQTLLINAHRAHQIW